MSKLDSLTPIHPVIIVVSSPQIHLSFARQPDQELIAELEREFNQKSGFKFELCEKHGDDPTKWHAEFSPNYDRIDVAKAIRDILKEHGFDKFLVLRSQGFRAEPIDLDSPPSKDEKPSGILSILEMLGGLG